MHNLKLDFKRWAVILALFVVFAVTYVSFYPSLCNGFVNWDDNLHLTENKLVHHLSWKSAKTIFTSFHALNYYPLTLLSFAIEYRLFGPENAFFYHATSLALHLINSLLVFWFIYMLSGRKLSVALLTALLFGVHPMHVEPVAWIADRRDVLFSAFFLGSLISYMYSERNNGRGYRYLSLLLFILSCMAKAIAFTMPVILLLIDYLRGRRLDKNNLLEKLPFFIIGIAFFALTIVARVTGGDLTAGKCADIIKNFSVAAYSIMFYLGKMVMPTGISAFYPYFGDTAYFIRRLVFFILFLILLLALAAFLKRARRKIVFGSLFFLISVLPVTNLFPSGMVMAADRYTYIAYIGFFYIAAEGFNWLYERKAAYRLPLMMITACVIAALSVLTWQRCHVWKDSITLWQDVLRKYPNELACNSLGVAYKKAGNYQSAMLQFNQAMSINPSWPDPFNNRGTLYYLKGDYDAAIKDFEKALELDPKLAVIHQNLGLCYRQKGEYGKAVTEFTKAIMLDPETVLPYYGRAECYNALGEDEKGKADISKAKELGP